MTEKICYTIERHVSGISLAGTIKYAPVAQLDRALDSDVSGPIRSEPAQPIAISGFQPMQRKNSFAVDYYLTILKNSTFPQVHIVLIRARGAVG